MDASFLNYSNVTFDTFGKPTLTVTYSQLFESLQLQFINVLFIVSIFFLVLTLFVLEYDKRNAPGWSEILDGTLTWQTDHKKCKWLLLRTIAAISFPLSLFFMFLMISVKWGLNL